VQKTFTLCKRVRLTTRIHSLASMVHSAKYGNDRVQSLECEDHVCEKPETMGTLCCMLHWLGVGCCAVQCDAWCKKN